MCVPARNAAGTESGRGGGTGTGRGLNRSANRGGFLGGRLVDTPGVASLNIHDRPAGRVS
jgi:hypothetical protein